MHYATSAHNHSSAHAAEHVHANVSVDPQELARFQRPLHALPYPYCTEAAVEAAMPRGSPALALYLHSVYGTAPDSLLHGWSWAKKDVLVLAHVPQAVRAAGCTSPLGNASSEFRRNYTKVIRDMRDVYVTTG